MNVLAIPTILATESNNMCFSKFLKFSRTLNRPKTLSCEEKTVKKTPGHIISAIDGDKENKSIAL